MRVRGGSDGASKKVWLERSEVDLLLDNADFGNQTGFVEADGGQAVFVDDPTKVRRFAICLGVRCGLRAEEINSVSPDNLVETDSGPRIEVGDGSNSRTTPAPEEVIDVVEGSDTPGGPRGDNPLLDVSVETLENWIREAAERCRVESTEEGWRHVDSRDLRRTWARLLVDSDVDSALVMEWGGWSSWQEFRQKCYGACPPEVERREASKAPWVGSERENEGVSTRKVSERVQGHEEVTQ